MALPSDMLRNKTHKVQVKFPDNKILQTLQIAGVELLNQQDINKNIKFEKILSNYNKKI